MKRDKREPKLKKVGCYTKGGEVYKEGGFTFFEDFSLKDSDVFIYNKGILFKIT